jgi:RhtB (resistance to homoserine/threonine) family protein
MIDFAFIGSLVLIHFLGLISPGPDFIVAIKNSLTYSRKVGLWTAVGFALGIGVHLFYCIAGLALLISKYIFLFNTIKYLGAGYLIYLGIKALITKQSIVDIEKEKTTTKLSPFKAVRIGFFTNVLNPKATLFFLSIFTLMVTPETSNATLYISSIIMIINTALWFMFVALFFTQKPILNTFNRFQSLFSKTLGGILIAIGIKVASMEK